MIVAWSALNRFGLLAGATGRDPSRRVAACSRALRGCCCHGCCHHRRRRDSKGYTASERAAQAGHYLAGRRSCLHTYYVIAEDAPVLVHNVNCPVIPLGAAHSDMAQAAMDYRMRNGVDAGQNVAVFRVGHGDDAQYHVAANVPGGLHSEEVLDNYIKSNGIDPDSVTGIYSERIPCIGQHKCSSIVGGYRRAEQEFSLNSDSMGLRVKRQNAGRIASAMGGYTGPSAAMPKQSAVNWVN